MSLLAHRHLLRALCWLAWCLKVLRSKTTSAHNKANRIFVYKRDGGDVNEDALKSQMRLSLIHI